MTKQKYAGQGRGGGRPSNVLPSVRMTISLAKPISDELDAIAITWPGITRAGLAAHFIKLGIDAHLIKPLKAG